ncbi:hypothetical protein SHIRM173S_08171 [Streptomyces hirsutus]
MPRKRSGTAPTAALSAWRLPGRATPGQRLLRRERAGRDLSGGGISREGGRQPAAFTRARAVLRLLDGALAVALLPAAVVVMLLVGVPTGHFTGSGWDIARRTLTPLVGAGPAQPPGPPWRGPGAARRWVRRSRSARRHPRSGPDGRDIADRSPPQAFRVDVHRVGHYDGRGAARIMSGPRLAGIAQPPPLTADRTVSCHHWWLSWRLAVPSDGASAPAWPF